MQTEEMLWYYKVNDNKIEQADEYKYLGVSLNNRQKCKPQICSKVEAMTK